MPVHLKDMPSAYHLLWFAIPLLVFGGGTCRYYLGLEWLDVVPNANQFLLLTAVFVPVLLAQSIWLRISFSQLQ